MLVFSSRSYIFHLTNSEIIMASCYLFSGNCNLFRFYFGIRIHQLFRKTKIKFIHESGDISRLTAEQFFAQNNISYRLNYYTKLVRIQLLTIYVHILRDESHIKKQSDFICYIEHETGMKLLYKMFKNTSLLPEL